MPLAVPHLAVHDNAEAAGRAAAADVAAALNGAIERQGTARALFASAPSQRDMLAHLRILEVDWSAVDVFHIDEYVGLEPSDPRGFGRWLQDNLFEFVQPRAVHLLNPSPADAQEESTRYAALLDDRPSDVACIGIGVNGHIAFNEPYEWEIEGGPTVRRVRLHDESRRQQVDDGCFDTLSEVPTEALSLSVPAILRAREIIVTVSGVQKARALRRALEAGISPECPATALQSHDRVHLHVDRAAFGAPSLAGSGV